MKKILSIVVLLVSFISVYSQVAIGTTNPVEGTLLIDGKGNNTTSVPSEVEAQDDFFIDREGNVGIGTVNPGYKLHVKKQSLGDVPVLRIEDGSQAEGKVLTTDSQGNATWEFGGQSRMVLGNLGSGYTGNIALSVNWIYSNANITLPPGKWVIWVSVVLDGAMSGTTSSVTRCWMRTTFCDASGSTANVESPDIISTNASTNISDLLYAKSKNVMNGLIIINNMSTQSKTYYYKIKNAAAVVGTGTWSISNFASNTYSENMIVAFKVMDN